MIDLPEVAFDLLEIRTKQEALWDRKRKIEAALLSDPTFGPKFRTGSSFGIGTYLIKSVRLRDKETTSWQRHNLPKLADGTFLQIKVEENQ